MSAIAKSGTPKPITVLFDNEARVGSGLICGEDIAAGDACTIRTDGLVYRADGSSDAANAYVNGFAATTCKFAQNDAVTLFDGLDWVYGSAMTPGRAYLSASVPGGLDTAAPFANALPIGAVIDGTRVRLFRSPR